MGLFTNRPQVKNKTGVPVWFMRQAGRYHQHYQNIKKDSDFMSMCKNPELACEITLGPIHDFSFDAAILFSDLLFPLEQLGMGLTYQSGPPELSFHLKSLADLKKINPISPAHNFYAFQHKACGLLRKKLPATTTLLGFVGAPFTLYTYAVEGSHSGNLESSKNGFYDGRYHEFMNILLPQLIANIQEQLDGGAQAMCLFDTAAGELTADDFAEYSIPSLKIVLEAIKKSHPDRPIIYYSKFTQLHYLECLKSLPINVLGVDWRMDMTEALNRFGQHFMIQGNLDPAHLHLPWPVLEEKLQALWKKVQQSKTGPEKWIAGLGHGVLQRTPETNVKKAVEWIHQHCLY
jgi:uroporphyrinogen decarboxylase